MRRAEKERSCLEEKDSPYPSQDRGSLGARDRRWEERGEDRRWRGQESRGEAKGEGRGEARRGEDR